jgi:hypothetical protein
MFANSHYYASFYREPIRLPTSQLVEALFQECSANNVDVFSFCELSTFQIQKKSTDIAMDFIHRSSTPRKMPIFTQFIRDAHLTDQWLKKLITQHNKSILDGVITFDSIGSEGGDHLDHIRNPGTVRDLFTSDQHRGMFWTSNRDDYA